MERIRLRDLGFWTKAGVIGGLIYLDLVSLGVLIYIIDMMIAIV